MIYRRSRNFVNFFSPACAPKAKRGIMYRFVVMLYDVYPVAISLILASGTACPLRRVFPVFAIARCRYPQRRCSRRNGRDCRFRLERRLTDRNKAPKRSSPEMSRTGQKETKGSQVDFDFDSRFSMVLLPKRQD